MGKVAPCVVDTNVAVAANAKSGSGKKCVAACGRALEEVQRNGRIIIDDGYRILREYIRNLKSSGQRGPGDRFLRWVLTNQRNPERCELVHVTPKPDDPDDFEECPEAVRAVSFDPSDRKFVAVAASHPECPCILQATDAKWWGQKDALAACGLRVEFLCPDEIAAKYAEKMGTP